MHSFNNNVLGKLFSEESPRFFLVFDENLWIFISDENFLNSELDHLSFILATSPIRIYSHKIKIVHYRFKFKINPKSGNVKKLERIRIKSKQSLWMNYVDKKSLNDRSDHKSLNKKQNIVKFLLSVWYVNMRIRSFFMNINFKMYNNSFIPM